MEAPATSAGKRRSAVLSTLNMLNIVLVVLLLPCSFASHYDDDALHRKAYRYELMCPENEQLQDTIPCCEPTCDNDCSNIRCPKVVVRQASCVCKPDFVRQKGKCIPKCDCPAKPPTPPTCGENEELLPSPPCCEPSCTDDCSDCACRARYVDQPTCVCKDGYRRHNGKCIRVDQCPTCGPYATLSNCAPCCEPTCDNDCSNVLCIAACQGDPVCVCQQGYVKHNSTCIKRELCPPKPPKPYCRCRGRKKQPAVAPVVIYQHPQVVPTPAPPSKCEYCHLPEVVLPVYYHYPGAAPAPTPAPTYAPVACTYAPPTPAPCAPPPTVAPPPPCPYIPPTTPKPCYHQEPAPTSYQDQPYYAIPALQHCNCGSGYPRPSCPKCNLPTRQCNGPPVSYNVATSSSTTTVAPPTTSAPCPCNLPPSFYSGHLPVPYHHGCPFGHPDQAYIGEPAPNSVSPEPIDVAFIGLPDPCMLTTTTMSPMGCFCGA